MERNTVERPAASTAAPPISSTDPADSKDGDLWQFAHERVISIRCFLAKTGHIKAVGTLRDTKGIPLVSFAGKRIEAGSVVHCIHIELIANNDLEIESIDVAMTDIPGELCSGATEAYQAVVGVSIRAGFSRSVRERLSIGSACTHTTNLLLQIGPAVVQTHHSRSVTPNSSTAQREVLYSKLKNTCYAFSKG